MLDKHRNLRRVTLKLIRRVSEINLEAAEYLMELYLRVPDGSDCINNFRLNDSVDGLITWKDHDNRRYHWLALHEEIGYVALTDE